MLRKQHRSIRISFWSVLLPLICSSSLILIVTNCSYHESTSVSAFNVRSDETRFAVSWTSSGGSFEAFLETGSYPDRDDTGVRVRSQLVIRDLRSEKIVYTDRYDETATSINLSEHSINGNPFIITTASAGSGEVLRGYVIKNGTVNEVISANYRDTYFVLLPPDGKPLTLMLADTDIDTNKFTISRYVLESDRFVFSGQMPFDDFGRLLESGFRGHTND